MPEENPIGLFEAIYTTRALRRFKPDPVPDEVLFQLFDAAIRAPSGQNAQDWRFVIVAEPAMKRRIANTVLSRLAANRLRAPKDMKVTRYVDIVEGSGMARN